MMDHDDLRFSSFTRDLARRQRRPRSYPAAPMPTDTLEQLCGGSVVIAAAPSVPGMLLAMDLSDEDLVDSHDLA